MQNVLQISKKIDYALLAMLHLSTLPEGTIVSFREIARACSLPKDFLGKIMKLLSEGRVVQSIRGAGGGYRLARPPREITFLQVIEAVEGPIFLTPCLNEPASCRHHARCLMSDVWGEAQSHLLEVLRKTTLGEVIDRQFQPVTISEILSR